MAVIPQAVVYTAYQEVSNCCLQCEKCSDDCHIKKARRYLLNFTKNGRQIDRGALNEQFIPDTKPFDRVKLKHALDAVEKCCQHCGENHLDPCFVNNARKALQILIHGKILPFDGYKEK